MDAVAAILYVTNKVSVMSKEHLCTLTITGSRVKVFFLLSYFLDQLNSVLSASYLHDVTTGTEAPLCDTLFLMENWKDS